MKEISLRETDCCMRKGFPVLKKKGIVSPYGEMTPFVFKNRLYRVESVNEFEKNKEKAEGEKRLLQLSETLKTVKLFLHSDTTIIF